MTGWHYAARRKPCEFEATGYIYELIEVFPGLGHTQNAVTVTGDSKEGLVEWLLQAAKDVQDYDVIKESYSPCVSYWLECLGAEKCMIMTKVDAEKCKLEKLEAFVMWIARDYVESSHDKVRLQRDDYIKRAKQLLEELYEN